MVAILVGLIGFTEDIPNPNNFMTTHPLSGCKKLMKIKFNAPFIINKIPIGVFYGKKRNINTELIC